MTLSGIIDTTVLIHLFRGVKDAAVWVATQNDLGVTSISRLEFLYGARGKTGLAAALKLLNSFAMVPLIETDQVWAEQQLIRYRLSRGVEINDSLIASICLRLQVPIYTHNVKDMIKLLPTTLVIKPY